jgi:dTMP kinase
LSRGHFITFEGGEGAGKTTQVQLLKNFLENKGLSVVLTREPGGSPAAERLREALLGLPEKLGSWTADTECLIHFAARCQHIADVIEPALSKGHWVICDRFTDSTIAYQGYASGVDQSRIRSLQHWALKDFEPDLTIILDLPVEAGLSRAASRGSASDIYERRTKEFHNAVRKGFLDIAAKNPTRCYLVNADQDASVVAASIRQAIDKRFG